ncbi:hypothetical protein ACK1KB_05490 [Chryseobacterium sp. TY3]
MTGKDNAVVVKLLVDTKKEDRMETSGESILPLILKGISAKLIFINL